MRFPPVRPYKNFGAFCLDNGSDTGRPYPCLVCQGRGRITVLKEPSSFTAILCPICKGTAEGTKEACHKEYQRLNRAYLKEKADYQRLVRLRRQALGKLTKDQRTAIKELEMP